MPKSPPVLVRPGSLKTTIRLTTPLASEPSEPVVRVQPHNRSPLCWPAAGASCSQCATSQEYSRQPPRPFREVSSLPLGGIYCFTCVDVHFIGSGDMHIYEWCFWKTEWTHPSKLCREPWDRHAHTWLKNTWILKGIPWHIHLSAFTTFAKLPVKCKFYKPRFYRLCSSKLKNPS